MNYSKLALSTLFVCSFSLTMEDERLSGALVGHSRSVQNLLDSQPNYQLVGLNQATLSEQKLTGLDGIENVDKIDCIEDINCDNNCIIGLEGTPFAASNAQCKKITFNKNLLTRLNPTFFTGLAHLTQLELCNNFITELPADWGPLVALTHLNLSRNFIRKIPAGSFRQLKELFLLSLNNNKIKDIHIEAGELAKVQILDLSSNSCLPETVEKDILADRTIPYSYSFIAVNPLAHLLAQLVNAK